MEPIQTQGERYDLAAGDVPSQLGFSGRAHARNRRGPVKRVLLVIGPFLFFVAAIALSVLDWRSRRRLNVFPVALALLLMIHVSVVTLYRIPLWKSAVDWFASVG